MAPPEFYRSLIYCVKAKAVIFAAIVFCIGEVSSQSNSPFIKQFTIENGLPQSSINDLVQDENGFVWLATAKGLSRFDGKNFKNYFSRVGDSLSLSNNYINVLEFDYQGSIWVGTNGGGINVFNSKSGTFHRVQLTSFKTELIINSIQSYGDFMYLSSPQYGIFKVNATDLTLVDSYPIQDVTSLFVEKSTGVLWIGQLNGNVLTTSLETAFRPTLIVSLTGNIQSFYVSGNFIFIGSYDGLYVYDFVSGQSQLLELEESNAFSTRHVVDFIEQDENSIWVATGRGLYLLSTSTLKSLKTIEYGDDSKKSLTNNTVTSLLNIQDNKLLVGTAGGLNLVDFSPLYFQNISKDKRGEHLLNDNVVFSIHKSGNDLLVGTSDGGLNFIRNGEVYQYLDDTNSPNSFVGSVVREICEDTINNRFWFATTRGLSMCNSKNFNPKSPTFKEFKNDPNDTNTITTDFLKGLALDNQQNIWGAAYQYGIFRLEYTEDSSYVVTRFLNEEENTNSLINDVSQCIRVDKQNRIWIGTGGGVSILEFEGSDYSNPQFTHFTSDSLRNPKSYLTHNSVYDITFVDDKVWLGTANGLNRINPDGTVDRWYSQDGFEDSFVYTVQNDDTGNLWLGTNDGLVRFNPIDQIFTRYTEQDQIQSKEFNIHARFKGEDGVVYMGGMGGVTYFDPNRIEKIDEPQRLYFSKLEIKDKQVEPYLNDQAILKQDILAVDNLRIARNHFPFYLTFSSIDYGFEREIQYAYKLLPIDTDWNLLEDNKIQFLNLPWGTHTLLVNGFSRGKEWNAEPLKITLTITPPWWLSSYMLFVYAILILALGYWFYRFTVSRKLARAESLRLKEIQVLRSGLYTNITHEFRTPLTVILGMADQLRLQHPNSTQLLKPIRLIERNGKRMLSLINNLLDLSKIEEGNVRLILIQSDIVPFIKYLAESFQTLAEQKDIQLMLYTELEHLDMDYDEEVIQIVISNLVSNALKFTPKFGKIVMKISKGKLEDRNAIVIRVRDDGMGIAPDDLDKIFNRFYQVETSISKSGVGTGIGLALVKQLVYLLKGEISVHSELGAGSEFVVKFPIYNQAPIKTADYGNGLRQIGSSLIEEELKELVANEDAPHILIIEDNEDVAYYIKACLEDYKITHALSGKEGLKLAEVDIPDIVICDLMMPEMDGFEVCTQLKSNDKTDHIPLIMLTAKDTDEDKLKGLAIGIDAYLTKPFNKEELLTRIDSLILQKKKLQEKYKQSILPMPNAEMPEIKTPKFLKKIDKIIHDCINNPDLNAEFLSQKIGMSESQIYRKLKALTDKSTAIYIRQVRLHKAYEMLKSGDRGVAEIAYDTGFKDPSWFSRSFKEEFGCAPSSFLQK
ncbi:hybrid sensor histidine kinase/response regulator transcription factor [Aegicerativicinus sediminis]|uniref:hybrid sensor histidine kinase/response regulator transcription factor n=1 Tax=Aegicerativicinus sediminis TaxID=2893202 RepID=UPI001E5E1106|nr:hybrid sensor histidine kinase/response regulator transcription factor [Aegicerativicinus sediminis]